MASCIGCRCQICARNCNLDPHYFTPGEVDECCFNCDDCILTNGTSRWDAEKGCYSGRWKGECPDYLDPIKHIEAKAEAARRSLHVVRNGSPKP